MSRRKHVGWFDYQGRADPIKIYRRRGRLIDEGGEDVTDHVARLSNRAKADRMAGKRRGKRGWGR